MRLPAQLSLTFLLLYCRVLSDYRLDYSDYNCALTVGFTFDSPKAALLVTHRVSRALSITSGLRSKC